MHCYDTAASTICANCEGVVQDRPYYRAYVRSEDRKQCLRMYNNLNSNQHVKDRELLSNFQCKTSNFIPSNQYTALTVYSLYIHGAML